MQTLHPQAPSGNPRGINDRRSHQCARRGWRGRKASPKQRALFIAESIQARTEEGRVWSLAEYGIDDNPHMIALISEHLGWDAAAPVRQEIQDTVIAESHPEGLLIVHDAPMTMAEAIGYVGGLPVAHGTPFFIVQAGRTVGMLSRKEDAR